MKHSTPFISKSVFVPLNHHKYCSNLFQIDMKREIEIVPGFDNNSLLEFNSNGNDIFPFLENLRQKLFFGFILSEAPKLWIITFLSTKTTTRKLKSITNFHHNTVRKKKPNTAHCYHGLRVFILHFFLACYDGLP